MFICYYITNDNTIIKYKLILCCYVQANKTVLIAHEALSTAPNDLIMKEV